MCKAVISNTFNRCANYLAERWMSRNEAAPTSTLKGVAKQSFESRGPQWEAQKARTATIIKGGLYAGITALFCGIFMADKRVLLALGLGLGGVSLFSQKKKPQPQEPTPQLAKVEKPSDEQKKSKRSNKLLGACFRGDLVEVKRLSDLGVSLLNPLTTGQTPIMTALTNRRYDVVKFILNKHPDLAHQPAADGNYLLHEVVLHLAPDAASMVQYLITECKVNVNALNNNQQTPLRALVSGLNTPEVMSIAKILIEAKADLTLRDKHGFTVAGAAVAFRNAQMLRLLADSGANLSIEGITCPEPAKTFRSHQTSDEAYFRKRFSKPTEQEILSILLEKRKKPAMQI